MKKQKLTGMLLLIFLLILAGCPIPLGVQHTVSFDSKGGSDVPSQTVAEGGHATEPTAPIKSGYDFKGWYSDSELTTAWNFTTDKVDAAQTLYAKWEVQQQTTPYTVSFDSKGGNPVSSQRVNPGGYATEPTAPTRSGYDFKGWYSDSELTTAWNFTSDKVDAAQTLYAKWEVQQQTTPYTVSFDSKGGNPVSSQRVNPGGYATEPTVPTRSGYDFKGWYSDSGLRNAWNFATDAVEESLTLYAKWEVQQQTTTYTVSFDSKGGSDVSSQRVVDGGYATEPTAPTRSGYIFQGWYSDSGLSKAWNFATDTVDEALTLYAKWKVAYSISFNSTGGSPVPIQTVLPGKYATEPPAPTKSGYGFKGWYSDPELKYAWNFTLYAVNRALTLYAKWGVQHTITFESKGGSPVPSQAVDDGKYATKPPAPTRSGYVFKGWYSDSGLSTTWNFGTAMTQSQTLYAKWIAEYSISFESNGGSAVSSQRLLDGGYVTEPPDPRKSGYVFLGWYSESGLSKTWNFTSDKVTQSQTLYAKWGFRLSFDSNRGSFVPSQIVAEGETAIEPPAPTRSGYAFKGWYSDSGLSYAWNFALFGVNRALTLYAKWELNRYTVSFESNGGSPEPKDQRVDHGKTVTEPPAPTRSGYVFRGWYSDSGLTKTWDFDSYTVTKPLTLYAKWIAEYSISFESNGGSPVPSSQTVLSGGYATEPPALWRWGWGSDVFLGWYSDSGFTTEWNFRTDVVTQDLTLYAKWGFRLSFHSNRGSFVPSQIVAEGKTATEPPAPKRSGYAFKGWYSDSGLTKTWDFATDKVNQSQTLYAKWEINRYTVSFESNVGSAVSPQKVDHGKTVTEPTDPTRSGYVFKGWYSDSGLTKTWDFATDKVNQALTLYAKWGVQYTITFESNGGSPVPSQAVDDGKYATKPPAPTRSGYAFLGWYSDSGLSTTWNFDTAVTQSQTLYAKWIAEYSISFESNGGDAVPSKRVLDGGYVTKPWFDPIKSGYVFWGWYSDSGFTTEWNFRTDVVTQDLTLYAKWGFRLSFHSNRGSSVRSQIVAEGKTATEPSAPTRYGYAFKGWYSDYELTKTWDFATDKVYRSRMLYAKWELNQYTVTFNSNGGSPVPSQRVYYDKYATEPLIPTKSGYGFKGWYSDPELKYAWNFHSRAVFQALTLYAKWGVQHTITFESNGGSPVPSQAVDDGKYAVKPPAPTRSGYAFWGWYSDSGLSTTWNFGTAVTQAQTLYAKWIVQHTITFESNGGSAVSSQRVTEGRYVTNPPAPRKSGYVFWGWYSDSGLSKHWDFYTDKVTQSQTLYAKWGFRLSFYSVGSFVPDQMVAEGETAIEPLAPTRSGYTFKGWYSDGGLTKTWDFATDTVDESLTLYAKWERNEYTITFDSTGGSFVPSQEVAEGETATEPPAPTRLGYAFKGWYSDSGLSTTWNFGTAVTQALTLYAKWELNQYTVTFDSKGGSPVPLNQRVYHGEYATEPVAPTKEGNVFNGWYSDSRLSNAWNFASDAVAQAQTLYAKWELNQYTVTFDSNGGSDISNQRVGHGKYAARPIAPTKSGYVFKGWYSDSGLTKTWDFATDKVTQSRTLYAKWGFLLSFDSIGGSFVPSQEVAEGETATEPPAPTRLGYAFKGWYSDSGLTKTWDFATDKVTQAQTLYAKWREILYSIGDTGPAGGKVFYDKGNYLDGWRYLEVAPSDQTDGSYEWGGYGTSVEISEDIGSSGQARTRAIVAKLGRDTVYAARICDELKVGGYDDWYLPWSGELDELYKQQEALGGLPSNTYWSSSSSGLYQALCLYLGDGGSGKPFYRLRNRKYGVLAVRSF